MATASLAAAAAAAAEAAAASAAEAATASAAAVASAAAAGAASAAEAVASAAPVVSSTADSAAAWSSISSATAGRVDASDAATPSDFAIAPTEKPSSLNALLATTRVTGTRFFAPELVVLFFFKTRDPNANAKLEDSIAAMTDDSQSRDTAAIFPSRALLKMRRGETTIGTGWMRHLVSHVTRRRGTGDGVRGDRSRGRRGCEKYAYVGWDAPVT